MKHEVDGNMDLIYSIWVVREVVWKLELEVIVESTPKLWQKPMNTGVALLGGSIVIFGNKECSDGNEMSVILP